MESFRVMLDAETQKPLATSMVFTSRAETVHTRLERVPVEGLPRY